LGQFGRKGDQKYKESDVNWKLLILQSLAEASGFLGFPMRNTSGTYFLNISIPVSA